jgi:hypothetical protein
MGKVLKASDSECYKSSSKILNSTDILFHSFFYIYLLGRKARGKETTRKTKT